ncbi:MAG: large-conductance mechanosensitive channel protein MscL [Coprobacillaceae bacterium]
MWKEFKEFAFRGNVVDLSVAVIMGAAFNQIVTSIVNDLIMPIVSILTGGIDFENLKYVIKAGDPANNIADVTLNYGSLIQNTVNFFLIAFCIFIMIKAINKFRSKEESKPVEKSPTSEELLTEIRDLLKDK